MAYRPLLCVLLLYFAAACKPARTPHEIARDKDGDGLSNVDDKCPDLRETRNHHNDRDGCPDHRKSQRGLWVPGVVTAGLGLPLILYGGLFTAQGLAAYDDDDPMLAGFEKVGIPVLVAGLVHEVIGIPLIVAGASDQWWSDEPRRELEPWPAAVRAEVSARGVGVRY